MSSPDADKPNDDLAAEDAAFEETAEVAADAAADPAANESPAQGVSLESLSDAFAQMLDPEGADAAEAESDDGEAEPAVEDGVDIASVEDDADDGCPISPHSILEAMLFVGDAGNEPLQAERVAQLIRGVEEEEVEQLVHDLNAVYESTGRPYEIRTEATGFRLALREEFHRVSDRFYGRVREAKLSQAAVEVLALVAYNQPLTSHRVNEMRGHPSGPILSQLVRRELLSMERPDEKPRTPVYHTTSRFLQLFGLSKLEELPQAEELER